MRQQAISIAVSFAFAVLSLAPRPAAAQAAPKPSNVPYDGELAKKLGGDASGMRGYVLVILKTGPNKVPEGPARTTMFEGHFANIARLAAEKKLALAGPLDGADGWRGIFVMATPDIDQAKKLVETDPVIVSGEMVAEYHKFYGSAGLMMVNEIHNKIQKK
ncbi:MAG: hypothetical protein JWR40_5068 [Massilia sp.]|jgi:uncharacterized protein YciI|nr:hypothetical protein [Massilia sp.]MDB5952381.1 hypothetical protein [Massilia sp.]